MERWIAIVTVLSLAGCGEKDVDASESAELGEACSPTAADDGEGAVCVEGLACERVGTEEAFVCGAPFQIRGQVFDALSELPLEGALVTALDESGAPVSDVAVSDAEGNYVLDVAARRDPNGEIADNLRWTLNADAQDYQPFPFGVRPAIPVNAQDAVSEPQEGQDELVVEVVDNASTAVALIPLPEDQRIGVTVSGVAGGEVGAGALIVAEGPSPAPFGVADASGSFTLFNVPEGAVQIRAYRAGVELAPADVTVAGETDALNLELVTEDPAAMGRVGGSVNIVNAPGGSLTSVVLVPTSVFNELLERGPVPFGLRAPGPPIAPDVSSGFTISGVPSGTYKVLAAFENDELVRDPDDSIAGTAIQEISMVSGQGVDVAESFKITEGLAIIGPGRDAPEIVGATPTFTWADDSSEDRYELQVFDALGNLVWEDLMVPGVSGGDTVEVQYGGSALTTGMYYQFRVTSFRDTPQGTSAISRTEDLRGVFVFGDPNG